MSEWQEIDLAEIYDFSSGLSKPRSEFGSGYPFLSFKDVFYNYFVPGKLESLVRTDEKERQRCSVQRGDVFLTRTSETMDELGMSCVALHDVPDAAFNGFTKRLRPKRDDFVLPEYAAYFFRSRSFREAVISLTTMSTRASLNNEMLGRLKIKIPPASVQSAIGSMLLSLDHKIELNRRMNETLEAMARAIFKDWFVDFGPTRAKAEGRVPYLAPDLWNLFPDALDDEDKPVGWEDEPVHAQASWVNGAAYKNMHFTNAPDALPVIKIAELKAGVTKNTKFTNTALGDKYRITDGELLLSWSGNPDTSIDTFIWTGGDAWLNQHIFAVRENGKRSLAFLFAMLKWLKPDFSEIARNKQTTGLGHVTQQDLKRLVVIIGSTEVMVAFDDLVKPIYDRIFGNLMEMRALAQTRDLLLPKLMSGEIQLAEAEKAVEAAV